MSLVCVWLSRIVGNRFEEYEVTVPLFGRREYMTEKRRHPRRTFEADITVWTAHGVFPGRSLEISESGMSAILSDELREGEDVELYIKLPATRVTVRAIVRHRNVFRHGFEFAQPIHQAVINGTLAGDCPACGGTGFVVKALGETKGVAFANIRCIECGGTGQTTKRDI